MPSEVVSEHSELTLSLNRTGSHILDFYEFVESCVNLKPGVFQVRLANDIWIVLNEGGGDFLKLEEGGEAVPANRLFGELFHNLDIGLPKEGEFKNYVYRSRKIEPGTPKHREWEKRYFEFLVKLFWYRFIYSRKSFLPFKKEEFVKYFWDNITEDQLDRDFGIRPAHDSPAINEAVLAVLASVFNFRPDDFKNGYDFFPMSPNLEKTFVSDPEAFIRRWGNNRQALLDSPEMIMQSVAYFKIEAIIHIAEQRIALKEIESQREVGSMVFRVWERILKFLKNSIQA